MREAFRNARAGLYKLAGVDLIREQLDACFDPHRFDYDVTVEGLRIWPRRTDNLRSDGAGNADTAHERDDDAGTADAGGG